MLFFLLSVLSPQALAQDVEAFSLNVGDVEFEGETGHLPDAINVSFKAVDDDLIELQVSDGYPHKNFHFKVEFDSSDAAGVALYEACGVGRCPRAVFAIDDVAWVYEAQAAGTANKPEWKYVPVRRYFQ